MQTNVKRYEVLFQTLDRNRSAKEHRRVYVTVATSEIDDSGTSDIFPLAVKAFRHAPSRAASGAMKLVFNELVGGGAR